MKDSSPGDPKVAQLLEQIPGEAGLPPVHLWDPPFCGDIDMRIARDGSWHYQGMPLQRAAMVRLFSRVLRRDGDRYFLVTPVEKVGIEVDDAPFQAVSVQIEGGVTQRLRFTTNAGDEVVAGADHPVRVVTDKQSGEPRPYIHVRAGLEALIQRTPFYEMVEHAVEREEQGKRWLGVCSDEVFFPIGEV
ncbi:DUF1285 domain-containing protein [Stutzerimonas tarimensis]|uniref:DUF1285 domain-containing protein n=1 Tax=Stutzerimonas tarimensis TaxID=1507735 RepID=A0ABV7T9V9_9GAMM